MMTEKVSSTEPSAQISGKESNCSDSLADIVPFDKPESRWAKYMDGFQRQDSIGGDKMNKRISKRHLRSMALSTGLGTGLLVGAGAKLHTAGPLFLLVGYIIVGFLLLMPCINAVGELSVAYTELPGGFQSYYSKFIDESMAFAVGWNYCIQWLTVISLELVTASMTVKFWNTSLNPEVIVTILYVVIVVINLSGSRIYAEAEFIMNSCKILMLTGFVIFGIIIDCGGGPVGFIGGRYWHHPGAYTTFKGLCTVFVTGAFSMGGSEFISLSASELENPKQAIPAACKLVFYKVLVLFLGSLTMVGLLVPYTSDQLMGSGDAQTHASPFVIAAEMHGVAVLPHIINAVILISVTSVATAGMYSGQRLLFSLAKQGYAPKYFDYVDKEGRPLRCFIFTVVVSLFSYIAAFEKQETVFTWLLSISGLSFIFTWGCICLCHIRFRAALKYNKIELSSLGFVAWTGVWGSTISLVLNILVIVAQFWIALWPYGGDGSPQVLSFFENFLGIFFFLLFYIGHKIWTKNWKFWIKVEDIEIDLGRVIYDPEILAMEDQELKQRWQNASFWKKALIFMFD
ncbi:amino-acid permease Gap1p [[Candida] anglica]|uniref:Amino-acid permease Gap1p n=1 Tax=[Candida] anglica TaxID=148631 RepID=A0ABP0EEJ0_9ASCO